jgi:hypothetical protein
MVFIWSEEPFVQNESTPHTFQIVEKTQCSYHKNSHLDGKERKTNYAHLLTKIWHFLWGSTAKTTNVTNINLLGDLNLKAILETSVVLELKKHSWCIKRKMDAFYFLYFNYFCDSISNNRKSIIVT